MKLPGSCYANWSSTHVYIIMITYMNNRLHYGSRPGENYQVPFTLIPSFRHVTMSWRGSPIFASVDPKCAAVRPRGPVIAQCSPPLPDTVPRRVSLSNGGTRPSAVSVTWPHVRQEDVCQRCPVLFFVCLFFCAVKRPYL